MNYETLKSALTINGGNLVISPSTLTANISSFLATYYAAQPIVIAEAQPGIGDGSNETVVIAGKASFLNMLDLPVTATFSLDAQGNAQILLRYTLIGDLPQPNSWKFSRSFPTLPTERNAQDAPKTPQISPLDSLYLFDTYFVVSTQAQQEPAFKVPLEQGINFVSQLKPTGVLGIFESTIGNTKNLTLYGTIRVPKPTDVTIPLRPFQYPWSSGAVPPGINLKASLGIDIDLGRIALKDGLYRIYSPHSTEWLATNGTFELRMAYTGELHIPSADINVELEALIGWGENQILLDGEVSGVTLAKLDSLLDLAGTGDLLSLLPQEIQGTLGKLELTYIGVGISLNNGAGVNNLPQIDTVYFTIGVPELKWQVWKDHFEVDNIACRFAVTDIPSEPSIEATVIGTIMIEDVPFVISASNLDNFNVNALLEEVETIPLQQLMKTYLPEVPAPGDLTIDSLSVTVAPGKYYTMSATIAQQPHPWVLDVGFQSLTVSNIFFNFFYTSGGRLSGSFAGSIAFGTIATLDIRYDIPADIVIRSTFPVIKLTEIIGTLCNQAFFLPGGFDLTFEDSSVLIMKMGDNYVFQFATELDQIGTFALEVRKVSTGQGQWGFAAGLDLFTGKASSLPALGPLNLFEELFSLQKLFLVVSSFPDPGFSFPDIAAFNDPRISAKKLTLPAQAGGVIAGFNLYAEWVIKTEDKQQNLLKELLGLNPTLGITLQVGEDPAQNARLYVSYTTNIQGHPLSCQFGGQIKDGSIGLFLTGSLTVTIQGQLQEFDVTLLFVENGAFVSATVKGSTAIDFEVFRLANLAIEIGVDWEAVPSVGVAGTISAGFESSVAVFFDSAEPSKSMVAGSLSDLSLKDVVDALAGVAVPAEFDAILSTVAVKGTQQFNIPGELANDLDNLHLDKVAAAFASVGKIQIPSSSAQALLIVDSRGSRWYLTDLTTMRHYQLRKQGETIQVSVEAQIYCAPQATAIGTILFPQGFYINGMLSFFGFSASATIVVNTNQGIAVDGEMGRIVIGSEAVFAIEKAQGVGGPQVSASTFIQPNQSDEQFRPPHFYINGSMKMLGMKRALYVRLTTSGFEFDLQGNLLQGVNFDVHGHFFGLADLEVGGKLQVGIDSIDLGPLGKINIKTGASSTMDVKVHNIQITATLDATFSFAGQSYSIPHFDLEINAEPLKDVPGLLREKIKELLSDVLKDAQKWANYVAQGFIENVTDVEKVLQDVYHMTAEEAKKVADIAQNAAKEVEKACAMTTAALHL